MNFQDQTKHARKKLKALVKAKLAELPDEVDGPTVVGDTEEGNKDLSYQVREQS